jgi:signal transduction histidine kinase
VAAVAGNELQVHVTTNDRSQGSASDRDLLRIAPEAINNAVRHARARTLAVTLASTAEGVHLRVEDDGIGIPEPSTIEGGTGLNSMRRRTESLGARLDVGRGGQGGTVVELQWTPTEPARSALSIWRARLRRGFLRLTAILREKRGTTS